VSEFRPVFFHVDLDAFFASVEQLDTPAYRGKPVIVGGDPGKRGVVSTCSYEARAFGVRSAMPTSRAVALCPQGIFLRGRMHRYHEKSREVMAIFDTFSPNVRQMSIDEAFLDMTGTERLFGDSGDAARALKKRVHDETGLTVSVGVAPNRYIAKIASGLSKPDGLVIVPPGGEAAFMAALRLKDVWGIGEKTRERLALAGLDNVSDLLGCSKQMLRTLIGEAGGEYLYAVLRGHDPGVFEGEAGSRSLSSERTLDCDVLDTEVLETMILELASELRFRLLDEGLSGRTVHLKIRYGDFRTVSIQGTGERNISDADDLFARACALFRKKYERGNPVRLIGVGVHNVTDTPLPDQMDLFSDGSAEKRRKVEEAVHALAVKRGKRLVTRARLIEKPEADEE
jgi:DNA polymerase-4